MAKNATLSPLSPSIGEFYFIRSATSLKTRLQQFQRNGEVKRIVVISTLDGKLPLGRGMENEIAMLGRSKVGYKAETN